MCVWLCVFSSWLRMVTTWWRANMRRLFQSTTTNQPTKTASEWPQQHTCTHIKCTMSIFNIVHVKLGLCISVHVFSCFSLCMCVCLPAEIMSLHIKEYRRINQGYRLNPVVYLQVLSLWRYHQILLLSYELFTSSRFNKKWNGWTGEGKHLYILLCRHERKNSFVAHLNWFS